MEYDGWVRFVFDHAVPAEESGAEAWYWESAWEFEVHDAARLLTHMTRMCEEMMQLGNVYSVEQIDQGIWFLLSGPVRAGEFLAEARVAAEARVKCVRAMYRVYAEYVPTLAMAPNCFDMWWDLVCGGFWNAVRKRIWPMELPPENPEEWLARAKKTIEEAQQTLAGRGSATEESRQAAMRKHAEEIEELRARLRDDERVVLDAMFETLVRILDLGRCDYFALHGLGHLHHEGVYEVVMEYLAGRGKEWPEDGRAWLQGCAEGRIM